MNAKEFISDLSLSIKERIKSRFFFSLIVFWLIFNWRALSVFLFSSKSIEQRIKTIDVDFSCILYTSIFPIILSIAFIILFPYLTVIIDKLTMKAKTDRHETLSDIEIDRINQQIKIEGKIKELEDAKSGNREITQLNNKIKTLQKQLESRDEEINTLQKELSDALKKLKNTNENNFYNSPRFSSISKEYKELQNRRLDRFLDTFVSSINNERYEVKFIGTLNSKNYKFVDSNVIANKYKKELDELVSRDIIDFFIDSNDNRIFINYVITNKGKSIFKLHHDMKNKNL